MRVVIGIANTKNKRTSTKKPRGRPRTSPMKTCCACPDPDHNEKPITDFYASDNPLFTDGHVPYCKECIVRLSFDAEKQTIDLEGFKKVLRTIDKPYIESALQMAIDQYNKAYEGLAVAPDNRKKIIGFYFSKIGTIKQYRDVKTWNDGVEYNKKELIRNNGRPILVLEGGYSGTQENEADERIFTDESSAKFEVTDEMIGLFGSGYKRFEYKAMWEKYQFLKQSYPDITNLHVEALVTYVRFKVKEEQATAMGDAVSADRWNQAASKAAEKAKINPNQLSKSDLQGGLNSFSELFQAVEQAVDIIPILPQFKYRPNDAIDFNIWCYVNYIRDLEGKPLCSYKEIYQFYDERKKEYIDQYGDPYGIFTGDPTEDNRESIEKFITLPGDYGDDS